MGFITTAYAAAPATTTASAQQQASPMTTLLFFAFLFVVMYLMIWRPQSKRAKEQRNLVESLAKGDEVVTNGGILGKIVKVTDGFVTLNIAQNVELQLQKQAISSILPRGTIKELEKNK